MQDSSSPNVQDCESDSDLEMFPAENFSGSYKLYIHNTANYN